MSQKSQPHKFCFTEVKDARWVQQQFILNNIDILQTEHEQFSRNPLKKQHKKTYDKEQKVWQVEELTRKNIINRKDSSQNSNLININSKIQQINIDDMSFMPHRYQQQKVENKLPTIKVCLAKKRSLKGLTQLKTID